MENIYYTIGFFGPIILFFITISYLLYNKIYNHLVLYILFFIINIKLNNGIKIWWKEERPIGGKSFYGEKYTGANKYGMPSGHAQSVFYSLVFLYLVSKSMNLMILSLIVSVLTIYQRWIYNRHTLKQLFVGSLIGCVFAYFVYIGFNMIKNFE
jgi:membrane-associated phospholipid phosphatase